MGVRLIEISLYLEPESKAALDSLTQARFGEIACQADTTSYRVKCGNSLGHSAFTTKIFLSTPGFSTIKKGNLFPRACV